MKTMKKLSDVSDFNIAWLINANSAISYEL